MRRVMKVKGKKARNERVVGKQGDEMTDDGERSDGESETWGEAYELHHRRCMSWRQW